MHRIIKLSLVAGGVLTVLALAASLLPGSRPLAQEGGVPPSRGHVSGEPSTVDTEEETDAVSAYLQIPGSALRPENSALVESAVYDEPGCILAISGDPHTYWNAPIYPPQGATLTKLRVYVYDASESANAFAAMGFVDAYGTEQGVWHSESSGSSGATYFEIGIPNHQVDYGTYSYLLWWQPGLLGVDMKVCGFRLYYTPPGGMSYLPSVMKNN